MELADDTHDYACTPCRHTGGLCFESLWLAQAMSAVRHVHTHGLPVGAEVVMAQQFHGCGQPCNVLLTLRGDEVEVSAGLADTGDDGKAPEPAARVTARPVVAHATCAEATGPQRRVATA